MPLPFCSFGNGDGLLAGVSEILEVRPVMPFLIGLRLLDLALRSSSLESVSSSISSSIGSCDAAAFFLADLVIGPKYPSFDASLVSEGVGEGEITLGVPGIWFVEERGMVKGGKDGSLITPERTRLRFVALFQ